MEAIISFKNELLRDYFISKFISDDGIIKVNKNSFVGLAMLSLYSVSKKRARFYHLHYPHHIKCTLSPSASIARKNFIYYDKESTIKINMMIESMLKLDFEKAVVMGRRCNLQYKEIIYAFIAHHNLNVDVFDMLSKHTTRQNQKLNDRRFEILSQLAKNIFYESN